jgi:hypothetical protein
MAFFFDTNGTAPQVLANLNGINSGNNLQSEVNLIGYARTLLTSLVNDTQNQSLYMASTPELHLRVTGSTGKRHAVLQIQLENAALDANLNQQTPGVNP